MKKFIFFISLCFLSLSLFAIQGSWQVINIPSPSLENCIFEESTHRDIGIYFPPSYDDSDKSYPVIYFLEGYGGGTDPTGYVAGILEGLILEEQVPELIFVAISGAYTFNGSFYVNSPITGNWKDFITQDVINYVDNKYRTIPDPASRGLTGMSMGGYGVLNISMLHPDVFGLAYSMSPGLFDENGIMNSQMFRDGGTTHEILELLATLKPLSKKTAHKAYMEYVKNIEDWNVEFTLAYGMAFAPNSKKAPYFDYPLKATKKGTIMDKRILQKWQNGFGGVEKEINKYANNLQNLKLLVLDCGYNDHYKWIVDGTLYYSNLLTKKRIPHDMIWNAGDHGSLFTYQMRHKVLPILAASLEFDK